MKTAYKLRAVVVLYHPDDEVLEMIVSIARKGYAPVAIANAIDATRLETLRQAGIDIIENATNMGLAVAFNQGIDHALASGAEYVMLLDQDTRPPDEMADRLVALADSVAASGRQLGCIGPVPVDRKRPGARTIGRSRNGFVDPEMTDVSTIISSGMVIPRAALETIGGMWNELFIDQIDHEWCFRARAAGLVVVAATSVPMPHDMGDAGIQVFGRYKPIHRSPTRHFHIVRNTLWLARCSFIPLSWRMVETVKLAARIPTYLLVSSARGQTFRLIGRAIAAGLRLPPGKTLSAPQTKGTVSSIT